MPPTEPLDQIWKGKAWSDGNPVSKVAQQDGSVAEMTASLGYAWNPNTGMYAKLPVDPTTGALQVTPVVVSGTVQPQDAKYKTWNFPPEYCSNNGAARTSGTLYFAKVMVPVPLAAVTNICLYIGTAGATLTAGQSLAALYSSDGQTRLGVTADQSVAWTTTGYKVMPISSVTVNPPFVLVAFFSVGTTPPGFARGFSGASITGNQVIADTFRWAVGTGPYTGLTAMPATITPTANFTADTNANWVALS